MAEDNKFFRWVWRFNGLVIALGVIALVIGAGVVWLWSVFYPPKFDEPAGGFAPVPKDAEKNATYRIQELGYGAGNVTFVSEGMRERFLALRKWEGAPASHGLANALELRTSSYYGRQGIDAVNLLIVNADSGESHWMFDGYNRAIASQEPIYANPTGAIVPGNRDTFGMDKPAVPPVGAVLWVRDHDDNGDGKLDEKDATSLYVYRVGMSAPVKLLTVDLTISTSQEDSHKYMVVYERGKKAFVAIYAMPSFQLLSQKLLPKLPE